MFLNLPQFTFFRLWGWRTDLIQRKSRNTICGTISPATSALRVVSTQRKVLILIFFLKYAEVVKFTCKYRHFGLQFYRLVLRYLHCKGSPLSNSMEGNIFSQMIATDCTQNCLQVWLQPVSLNWLISLYISVHSWDSWYFNV